MRMSESMLARKIERSDCRPMLLDEESLLSREFGVDHPSELPVVLLVDEEGLIRASGTGYDTGIIDRIRRELSRSEREGG